MIDAQTGLSLGCSRQVVFPQNSAKVYQCSIKIIQNDEQSGGLLHGVQIEGDVGGP